MFPILTKNSPQRNQFSLHRKMFVLWLMMSNYYSKTLHTWLIGASIDLASSFKARRDTFMWIGASHSEATQSWQSTNHSYFQVATQCAQQDIYASIKKEQLLHIMTTYDVRLSFFFTWNSILYPSKSHLKLILLSMWS